MNRVLTGIFRKEMKKMNAEICYLTKNGSYSSPDKITPVGIVVHSTGVNQTKLARYVQPSDDDPNRDRLLSVLGKNKNGNSWNRPSVQKSVHFMIGKFADGKIGTVQTLPLEYAAWGVGRGKKGSYNYSPRAHIQFEVLEDNLSDKNYFQTVYNEAVELCASLCREYGWDENVIVSHHEAYLKGYASNHADIDHWLKKYKLKMDDFRNDVAKQLDPYITHRVVKGNTLKKIAKSYGTTTSRIVELNREKYPSLASNPNLIKVGWTLTIDR